jgi:hypothetical protein
MPEPDAPTLMILLAAALCLLGWLLVLVLGVSRRLARLERRLAGDADRQESADAAAAPVEYPAGGAFEAFLDEDPARRELPKGEQFAAYRRWRHERGMNWSNP